MNIKPVILSAMILFVNVAVAQIDSVKYFLDKYSESTGNHTAEDYRKVFQVQDFFNNVTGAEKILNAGLKKFPNNSELLFARVNFLLKINKLAEAIIDLKGLITIEPANAGLYYTLGQVYEQLYQTEEKINTKGKATEYFEAAKNYYSLALKKDPNLPDACYSLGALYYNKAVRINQEIAVLSGENSDINRKKIEILNEEVMRQFNLGLPWFKKAESLNPNDIYTIKALYIIYESKNDNLKEEFKKRLSIVEEGGKNNASFFKN